MTELESDSFRLTDFLDVATLQEIQDSFGAVANVKASITDAEGKLITQANPTSDFLKGQQAIAAAEEDVQARTGPHKEGGEYVAPIIVNNQRLGTIRMRAQNSAALTVDEARLVSLAQKYGLDVKQVRSLVGQIAKDRTAKPAAIQFLYLLANAIARLCFQEYQLRQRIHELTAVYNVTMMLADARDLQKVLQRTVQVVCEVMETKAASLRLVDPERDELVVKATYNLSPEYIAKGPIHLSTAPRDRTALSPKGYEYVRNLWTDAGSLYPEEARREGIVSVLSAGMRYKGKPIGVLRVYTDAETTFSPLQIDLLKAVAAQAAAAIENARLLAESIQAQALERQVQMAAEVQQRMIPRTPPSVPHLDVAAVYVPCFELGGDFYDLIPLPSDNLGLAIADVSGKGVPASLIMASVRAALRAQVDNVYYLYEVVRRINAQVCRDSRIGEFVTLFYGVLDANNKRLTYCNAGHPPGLVLRQGKIIELPSENMVLGVEPDEQYAQHLFELQSGDFLLLYTDGLPDAMNFKDETFGRQRLLEAFSRGGETADAVAQGILWEMRKFVGLTRRTDDVTMIVVRVT
ncbi:MAG TPA: SpoIIE family protein phosphatase [Tepidisphaeraceae bacterium]|nr:SpoIIE family protein phosphatase [Tepidisphaeraceae bacterium]